MIETKIYDLLKEASRSFNENIDFGTLMKVKEELEKEIKLAAIPTTTTKQRVNHCLGYSKKLMKGTKPILGYTENNQLEGLQVFTDSFFLVELSEEDKLPIEDWTSNKNNSQYPCVTKLVDVAAAKLSSKVLEFKISDLLVLFKLSEIVRIKNDNCSICLHKDNFNHFYQFMNFNTNDTIKLILRDTDKFNVYPATVLKDNGTIGIILPVRDEGLDNIQELIAK